MEKAMRFCEEKNFQQVHLSTFAGLDPARHLYEKWGFQLVEEKALKEWPANYQLLPCWARYAWTAVRTVG